MHIYSYWYRATEKEEPKVVKVFVHSQGSTALFSDTINRTHLLGTFILKWNSTGVGNPEQVDATGYFSEQSARMPASWEKMQGATDQKCQVSQEE